MNEGERIQGGNAVLTIVAIIVAVFLALGFWHFLPRLTAREAVPGIWNLKTLPRVITVCGADYDRAASPPVETLAQVGDAEGVTPTVAAPVPFQSCPTFPCVTRPDGFPCSGAVVVRVELDGYVEYRESSLKP